MHQSISSPSVSLLTTFAKKMEVKTLMQNLLLSIGVLTIVLVISFIVISKMFTIEGEKLDSESNNYVQAVVPDISETFDAELLYSHSDVEFRKVTSKEELQAFFTLAQEKLGKYQYFEGAEGESHVSYTTTGKDITASYIAKVHYKNAPAFILINLINRENTWLIQGYRIESPIFSVFEEQKVPQEEKETDVLEFLPSSVLNGDAV